MPSRALQSIPPEYGDVSSASLRVSQNLLKQLNAHAGQWVEIENESGRYTCRIWPSKSLPDDVIQVDKLISTPVSEGTDLAMNDRKCTIVPILAPQTAIHVIASAKLQTEDEEMQKQEIGFLFKDASDDTKLNTVCNTLDRLVVQSGSTVAGPAFRSCLSISIISTVPSNSHVQITPATRISLQAPSARIPTDSVDSLVSSLASVSLDAIKTKGTPSLPGLEKAYEALLEIVSYPLIYPALIKALRIECPKGIILHGPPGVGKTFLVSSIAQACNAKMVTIHGPEVYGPYVGESEEKLRAKFDQARAMTVEENVPVILFIDELDSLTPHRAEAQSHESRVVAQLLTLMDGVTSRGRIVVVGATNRPNAIDPALRRPGRFDREVSIDAPTELTRHRILESQTRTMPLADDVDIGVLARMTNGYVGADLASLCREAALGALDRSVTGDSNGFSGGVTMRDFQTSMSRVGPSMQRGVQVEVEMMQWEDIGGLEDVKKKLRQAVEWPVKHRATFERLGLRPPRGILLYGPPGCSKTTLVKVIASTSGASFLSINGAQLYSPYVGDSEKIIRSTFQKARSASPSVIFFDEIDAIVGKRSLGNVSGSGDSVQERVLSMLLNEMDGVESATSVLVVGATNRPDMLDAALLRPGRFDKLVYVPPPDFSARLQILQIHTRGTPLAEDVDLEFLAQETDMYTGADLNNLCREAAMIALRGMREASVVEMQHFRDALQVVKPSLNKSVLRQYEAMNEKY